MLTAAGETAGTRPGSASRQGAFFRAHFGLISIMCLMMSEHVSVSVISTTMKVSRTIAISRELHFPEPRAREGPQLPQPEGAGGKAAFM